MVVLTSSILLKVCHLSVYISSLFLNNDNFLQLRITNNLGVVAGIKAGCIVAGDVH